MSGEKAEASNDKNWGLPIQRLDRLITSVESKLLLALVVLEVSVLSFWVFLRGFTAKVDQPSSYIRVAVLAGVLGLAAFIFARKSPLRNRAGAAGLALGAALGFATRSMGAPYFQNLLNWMENASVLLMIGGLRGVATRLTLWVALLGASLATGRGKHITIDIALRFASAKARLPMALASWAAAALVCFAGAWGFVDHVAVTEYRVDKEFTPTRKVVDVLHDAGNDWFLARKQISLDLQTLPRALQGEAYNRWLTPKAWNAWVKDAGFEARYPQEAVDHLLLAEDRVDPKLPTVEIPGHGEPIASLLVRSSNLLVPFGLLMIGIRFILRMLLALAGLVRIDPDAAHASDDDEHAPTASHSKPPPAPSEKAGNMVYIVGGTLVALLGLLGGPLTAFVGALAVTGAPLFAIMGGSAELAWLSHADKTKHALRFIAPNVLDDRFAGSPILVTIPLFTLVGYILARAKTAERIVRVSTALLGWMPGGLGVVCVLACAVFTLLTGGSGVTIIAIGGLLLPAIRKRGYGEDFSLGLLTSGGSLGLLLPFSLPLLVYALVAGIDLQAANKAVIGPGIVVLLCFASYSIMAALRGNMPWGMKVWLQSCDGEDANSVRLREAYEKSPSLGGALVRVAWNLAVSIWDIKWELLLPVIIGTGVAVFGLSIDEVAGLIAGYTIVTEAFVYEDISIRKDLPKVVANAITMAGAIIIILTMANALVNYVIDARIPEIVFDKMVRLGVSERWQFLLLMNLFLLVLGMLMEGFSAIFVAVPLILPFAARFHLGPFHVGMIFLLNLELAYCMPPLGLNLFIAGFRFGKPATALYKPILPFLGILFGALMLISYVPSISNFMVRGQIQEERDKAKKKGEAPREAWLLECIQEDRLNPLPCSDEDRAAFPGGKMPESAETAAPKPQTDAGTADSSADDDLLKDFLGDAPADTGLAKKDGGVPSDDDLLKDFLSDSPKDAGKPDAGPAKGKPMSDQDVLDDMLK
jgi:C4-dicarboxylate transporter, DctM subunit